MQDAELTTKAPLMYWEDLRDCAPRTFGPVTISLAVLDQLLELTGEKHPIHLDDSFARATLRAGRIVPGGIIHAITSGWMVERGSAAAVVGLRSMTWDFVRPIYPDVPFHFTNTHVELEEVDESIGLVKSVRRVFGEGGRVHAIGRLSSAVLRRPVEANATTVERVLRVSLFR